MLIDSNHGYIIFGNLNIANDPEVRKVMEYGVEFRLTSCFSVKKIMQQYAFNIYLFVSYLYIIISLLTFF